MRIIRGYFLRWKRNSKCYLEKLCMKNMYEVMASDVFIRKKIKKFDICLDI